MGHGVLKITIAGPLGSGKTVMAHMIANKLAELGAQVAVDEPAEGHRTEEYTFDHVGLRGDYYDEVIIETRLSDAMCHDCMGLGSVGNMNTGEMEGCGVCKGTGRVEV